MTTTVTQRVTTPDPVATFDDHRRRGGGRALAAARAMAPGDLVALVEASGLRGRGGGGFPTGRKWRTVAGLASPTLPTSVVVNAAEGEPGTWKDRHLLLHDPWSVLEGALVAAHAVGAGEVVVALKGAARDVTDRVEAAVAELTAAGFPGAVALRVVEGPDEYLYGEETALLEVVDGRLPFPRLAPPWRRGVVEVVEQRSDVGTGSGLSAHVELSGSTPAPPALVNNVETLANVAALLAHDVDWFRSVGTAETPGTFVCTVTGDTTTAGVAEVAAGTSLREVIDAIGGGVRPGRRIAAVLSGTANAVITADALDVPVSYEAMQPLGLGPGSAGFVVFDDTADMVAVAAGVSRFLAVESCGQCTPCKLGGMEIARLLAALCANEATAADLARVRGLLDGVAEEARCNLASQQQLAVTSILDAFPDQVQAHVARRAGAVRPTLVAELLGLDGGVARWDEHHRAKQPDWTFSEVWRGSTPAEAYADHRSGSHPDA